MAQRRQEGQDAKRGKATHVYVTLSVYFSLAKTLRPCFKLMIGELLGQSRDECNNTMG